MYNHLHVCITLSTAYEKVYYSVLPRTKCNRCMQMIYINLDLKVTNCFIESLCVKLF